MVLLCDIAEYSSLCCDLSVPEDQHYETMRAIQNQKWAEQRLLRGVEFAKEGKYNEALRCYSEAIELVPKYAEAYTARGAAYGIEDLMSFRFVKMGKYKESVNCFEIALRIDENTPNAKQYLERALTMQEGRPSIRSGYQSTSVFSHSKTRDMDKKLLELMKKDDRLRSRSSQKRQHYSHERHHHHSLVCNKQNPTYSA